MTHTLIFGKLGVAKYTEIPGFVPDSTARHWRAFLFLGVGFLLERELTTRANHSHGAGVSVKIWDASRVNAQHLAESSRGRAPLPVVTLAKFMIKEIDRV